jgi:hypothetical protein
MEPSILATSIEGLLGWKSKAAIELPPQSTEKKPITFFQVPNVASMESKGVFFSLLFRFLHK